MNLLCSSLVFSQMGLMDHEAAFLRLVDKLTNGTKVSTTAATVLVLVLVVLRILWLLLIVSQ